MNGIIDFRGEAIVDLGLAENVVRCLRGGARDRRGDRKGVCGRGCACRGHRSRPERPRSGPLTPAVSRPGGRCDRLCRRSPGSPGSRASLRPVRPRRLRRRRRLGQIRLSVLEARAGRLGARAENQPDRRGERGARVRPRDGGRGTLRQRD